MPAADDRPSSGRLAGDVALVTGGGAGIGRAVVDRFVAEGARVGVLERRDDAARELVEALGDRGVVTVGDVRSPADNARAVADVVAAFGRLDAVVPNAGIWDAFRGIADYVDGDELAATCTELFDVNVRGPLLAAHAAREALRESRGAIVCTISSSGTYAGGGGPVYVASKHAMVGVVRQLAYELAPDVRVNAVAPGLTVTELRGPASLGLDASVLAGDDGLAQRLGRSLPLGFAARPADHASLFVLLASRVESRFVTGAIIPSDGGMEVRGGGRRHGQEARA